MTQSYSSTIKDHYHHPRNSGKLAHYTHIAEQTNPLCGDETKLYLKIEGMTNSDDRLSLSRNLIIKDISHETRGCMICVASASVLSEYARGKNLSQVKKLGVHDVAKFLGVSISPAREQCALLFLNAIRPLKI